jgi:hypothetical protein
LTPSKRLQNVKSSKKIDYIQGFVALENPAGWNQFRAQAFVPVRAKNSQGAQFRHGGRLGVMGSSRMAISPDIHGERPDAAWRLTGNAIQ